MDLRPSNMWLDWRDGFSTLQSSRELCLVADVSRPSRRGPLKLSYSSGFVAADATMRGGRSCRAVEGRLLHKRNGPREDRFLTS
jgi:hypothetical protein